MKKQVQQLKLSEQTIASILAIVRLEWQEEQLLKKRLKKKNIQTLTLRQTLCQENKFSNQAYYLVQGTVNLLSTLKTGEKIIISQVNEQDFLNLQMAFNDGKSKYTIAAASPYIHFIDFDEKDSLTIALQLRQKIFKSMDFRQKERIKREKKTEDQRIRKKIQKQIDKLKLPSISFPLPATKSNIIQQLNDQPVKIERKPDQFSLGFSRALKNIGKSTSLNKLSPQLNRAEVPENNQGSNLQKVTSRLLENYHEYQDKITFKKLERLKSERSMSLGEKSQKIINYSRNQRLFKEQLKHIVKRKLMFERKHFKILKKLNNKDIEKEIYIEEDKNGGSTRYADQMNPIDNYFEL